MLHRANSLANASPDERRTSSLFSSSFPSFFLSFGKHKPTNARIAPSLTARVALLSLLTMECNTRAQECRIADACSPNFSLDIVQLVTMARTTPRSNILSRHNSYLPMLANAPTAYEADQMSFVPVIPQRMAKSNAKSMVPCSTNLDKLFSLHERAKTTTQYVRSEDSSSLKRSMSASKRVVPQDANNKQLLGTMTNLVMACKHNPRMCSSCALAKVKMDSTISCKPLMDSLPLHK